MTFCYNCSPGPPKILDLPSPLILVRKVVLSDLPRPPIADFKYPQMLDLKITQLKKQIQLYLYYFITHQKQPCFTELHKMQIKVNSCIIGFV